MAMGQPRRAESTSWWVPASNDEFGNSEKSRKCPERTPRIPGDVKEENLLVVPVPTHHTPSPAHGPMWNSFRVVPGQFLGAGHLDHP